MKLTKKRVFLGLLGIIIGIPLVLILWVYLAKPGSGRLYAAIAATDQLDPHWRLADLEEHRQKIDDDRNSALVVIKAFKLLPDDWQGTTRSGMNKDQPDRFFDVSELLDQLYESDPEFQLSERQRESLARIVEESKEALGEARKLADLPWGRYDRKYDRIVMMTQAQDVQNLREVNRLLTCDAVHRAAKGDTDGALVSCRAMVNVGRSIGDDPMLIAQLVRIACVGNAISTMQRILALGEPKSDEPLAQLEAILADEAKQPLDLYGIRGERAFINDTMTKLTSGEMSLDELSGAIGGGFPNISVFPTGVMYRNSHATMLEWLNEASLIATQKPRHEQESEWKRLDQSVVMMRSNYLEMIKNIFAVLMLPAIHSASSAASQHYARIGCGRLMIAMERYRLKHNAWPENPQAALVPDYLDSWPRDAFVDAPINMERLPKNWRIFSVGLEKKPDGVASNPRMNIVFRLLDPDQRNQPQPQPSHQNDEPSM